jgi:hypothetical protein
MQELPANKGIGNTTIASSDDDSVERQKVQIDGLITTDF